MVKKNLFNDKYFITIFLYYVADKICARHFTKDCFQTNKLKTFLENHNVKTRIRLKEFSAPTLYLPYEDQCDNEQINRDLCPSSEIVESMSHEHDFARTSIDLSDSNLISAASFPNEELNPLSSSYKISFQYN